MTIKVYLIHRIYIITVSCWPQLIAGGTKKS